MLLNLSLLAFIGIKIGNFLYWRNFLFSDSQIKIIYQLSILFSAITYMYLPYYSYIIIP